MLNPDQVMDFDRHGFVLVKGMFSGEEVEILLKAVHEASRVEADTFEARDVDGNVSRLSLWKDIGEMLLAPFQGVRVSSIRCGCCFGKSPTTGTAKSC
ncbi:MAG: hypothetical protein O7E52_06900 [Candidatus Poribacteria bacterium]|nr:hypothetical protein [Candidatus Poribacteria bacterium]